MFFFPPGFTTEEATKIVSYMNESRKKQELVQKQKLEEEAQKQKLKEEENDKKKSNINTSWFNILNY